MKKYTILIMSLLFFIANTTFSQNVRNSPTNNFSRKNSGSINKFLDYPWKVILIPKFSDSYRKAFIAYLGKKWIAKPQLGEQGKIIHGLYGDDLILYQICKPHDCGNQRAVFIYKPKSNQMWAWVKLGSKYMRQQNNTPEIDKIFNKYIGSDDEGSSSISQ